MKPCISQATTMPSSFADDVANFADAGCSGMEVWLTKLEQHLEANSAADTKKEQELAGAWLFRDKGCAYCHGTTGLGTKKGPSLADVRKKLKAPQIASQIKNGGQKMPPFDSLSDDEVARLVSYLRAKHRPAPPPAVAEPTSPPLSNPAQQKPEHSTPIAPAPPRLLQRPTPIRGSRKFPAFSARHNR